MTTDVLALADRLWRGEVATSEYHPVSHLGGLAEICDDVAFLPAFANVTAIATDDGLVLVDTGSAFVAAAIHEELRRWTGQRLHTAVYSHGHIDHVFGVGSCDSGGGRAGLAAADGHRARGAAAAVRPLQADRRLQRDHQPAAVRRPTLHWPTEYRYPDATYPTAYASTSAARRFELRHEKGETDDHTWTWMPERKGAVLRRPVHLGVPERRQPAEGAALPAGVGRRAAPDDRAGARVPAARPRRAGRRCGPGQPGARPTRRRCWSRWSTRRSR